MRNHSRFQSTNHVTPLRRLCFYFPILAFLIAFFHFCCSSSCRTFGNAAPDTTSKDPSSVVTTVTPSIHPTLFYLQNPKKRLDKNRPTIASSRSLLAISSTIRTEDTTSLGNRPTAVCVQQQVAEVREAGHFSKSTCKYDNLRETGQHL